MTYRERWPITTGIPNDGQPIRVRNLLKPMTPAKVAATTITGTTLGRMCISMTRTFPAAVANPNRAEAYPMVQNKAMTPILPHWEESGSGNIRL